MTYETQPRVLTFAGRLNDLLTVTAGRSQVAEIEQDQDGSGNVQAGQILQDMRGGGDGHQFGRIRQRQRGSNNEQAGSIRQIMREFDQPDKKSGGGLGELLKPPYVYFLIAGGVFAYFHFIAHKI